MKVSKPSFKLASLAVLTILAACGGGGGDSSASGAQSSAVPGASGSANSAANNAATTPASQANGGAQVADANNAAANRVNGESRNAPAAPTSTTNVPTGSTASTKPTTVDLTIDQSSVRAGNGGLNAAPPAVDPVNKTAGAWTETVDWPVIAIHAALTPDGRVMTFGTDHNVENDYKFRYDVWDPTVGTGKESHTLMPQVTDTFLFCAAQILLQDGRLMILGGDLLKDGRTTSTGDDDVNLYDPKDNSMVKTQNGMALPRWYASATMLPNGDVYVQGGTSGEEYPEVRSADGLTSRALKGINTLQKYTLPNGNTGFVFDNNYPRNFLASNGKIFGFDPHFMYEIDTSGEGKVKLFGSHWDVPHSETKQAGFWRGWSATSATAMVRPDLILQFGGENQVTLIDISSGSPKLIDLPSLDKAYHWSNATILPDGNVLISGGSSKNLLLDMEEPINQDAGEINYDSYIFNPDTRTFTKGAAMKERRLYHSVSLLLPDGSVMSSGGGAPGPATNLNAQIYRPGYLFNADGSLAKQPVLEGSDGGLAMVVEPTASFSINSPDAADIAKVTLIKTGATTHSFDMDQRYVELKYTVNGNALDIALPANKYLTPPGYYHVFAINKAGVPSKSRIIRINPSEKTS